MRGRHQSQGSGHAHHGVRRNAANVRITGGFGPGKRAPARRRHRVKKHITPAWLAAAAILIATAAFAAPEKISGGAGNVPAGAGEAILVAQIALLLLVGRGLGEIMQRLGQPSVIGQLLAGLILGPSFFGWIWPEAHAFIFPDSAQQKNLIAGISDVGVMMLLLLTGMETDIKLVRRVGLPAITVAFAGATVPF